MSKKITPLGLMLTDTHLKDDNTELVKDIFLQTINYCKEFNINKIFYLGDWFNSRKAQTLKVLDTTKEIIKMFELNNITCYIIKGNHDAVEADSEKSFVDIFSFSKAFLVFEKERNLLFSNTVNICFLPYFKEDGSLIERLKNIETHKDKINILLTHIAINGVKNNDGSRVENNVGKELFKRFDKVFVGHYHDKSQIGDNIFYIGSAYQANFGEDNDKGFSILNNDGSIIFIKSNFPEFKKIKISATDKEQLHILSKNMKDDKNNIRFEIEGTTEECKMIDKKIIEDLGIDVKFNNTEIRYESTDELISFDRNNITEYFNKFCSDKNLLYKGIGDKYLKTILK